MYFKSGKILSTLLVAFSIILAANAFAQHDPGRNALRLLAKGKVDTALVVVNQPPNERNSSIQLWMIQQ